MSSAPNIEGTSTVSSVTELSYISKSSEDFTVGKALDFVLVIRPMGQFNTRDQVAEKKQQTTTYTSYFAL